MYATRGTDWQQVGEVLRRAHVGWCIAVVALSVTCHVVRSERWRVLLRPVGALPRWPLVAATFIGFGANSVLPLRLGELVRPAFLARRVGVALSPTVSSIVIERIFDTLLVLCCLLLVGVVYEVPPVLRGSAIALAVGAAIGLVVLVVLERHRETAERLVRGILRPFPERVATPVWSVVDGLLHGLGALADVRIVLVVLLYSVVLWAMITLTYTLSFFALDVRIPLVAGSLVTVVIVAAFVFLPQAPGFVGTWQAGCVFALHHVFGVPHDVAVGYSLLTWVLQMTANVGAALVAFVLEGVSVRELVAESRGEVSEA